MTALSLLRWPAPPQWRHTLGLALCLMCGHSLALGAEAAAWPSTWPQDITRFLQQRQQCDHWRGEDAYDRERLADIQWMTCQHCRGTDARLQALARKYANRADILAQLQTLEPRVEPSPRETQRVCRQVRKPQWLHER